MEYRVVHKENGYSLVTIVGAINEDADIALQNIKAELKQSTAVLFNFAQSASINSLGVRGWVQFLRGIEEGRKIQFEECTPDVIMQINMIPNFAGKATINSFYTSYICESCNAQQKILINKAALPPKTMPERQKCKACGEMMETEELEEEYFAFLSR